MNKIKKNHKTEKFNSSKWVYDYSTEEPSEKYQSIFGGFVYAVKFFDGVKEYDYYALGNYRNYKTTLNERRKWYDYVSQFKDYNLEPRNRRNEKSLPNAWDDEITPSFIKQHKRSWKSHTKCKKQWMKNL